MSDKPKRIQRNRRKDWRMPSNAVYVGRPTKWGNPFAVGEPVVEWAARRYGVRFIESHEQAASLFRRALIDEINRGDPASDATADAVAELRGKDLACWCPIVDTHGDYVPCHADVLLSLANDTPLEDVVHENHRRAKGEAVL